MNVNVKKLKRFLTITVICILVVAFRIDAKAENENGYPDISIYFNEQSEASGASDLPQFLDENSREYLEAVGCNGADIDGIMSFSLRSVFEMLMNMLRANISSPLKGCMTACGAVMLVSVCSGFFPDDEKTKGVMNLVCGCFIILSVFVSAVESVRAGASAMKLCSGFEKALIPVLAGIVTASGNPTAAISYQGTAFAAAQAVEAFADNVALPLVYVSGVLGATGAFLPTMKLSAVSEMIRKTSTTVFASVASVFAGFLTLKNVIAGSADGLAAKGIRLAANTFIPVVGGALGEAYSALSGSLSLLKSVVGIYGILAVLAVCLPSVISLTLWVLAMRTACMMSDLLGNAQCSEILKNISFMFSMLNVMIIFSSALFIISSGLVAAMKTGG